MTKKINFVATSLNGSKETLNGTQEDKINENMTPEMNQTQNGGSEAQIKKDQDVDKDNIVCIDITDINVLNELRNSLKAMETDNNEMISKNATSKK